jgi:ATP-binding cassette, subfamily B, bacterial
MYKVISLFLQLQKPHRVAFIISLCISICAPLLGDILAPLYFASFTKNLAEKSTYDIVSGIAIVYALILLTQTVVWRIGNYLLVIVQQKTLQTVSDHVSHHLLSLSIDFFKENSTGALVNKATKFGRVYEKMYDEIFYSLIPSIVIFVCIMPVLLVKIPLIGAGMIIVGILFAFMTTWFSQWIQPHNDELSKIDSKVTGIFADQMTNIAAVRSCGKIEEEKERFSHYNGLRSEKRKIAWMKGYVQWTANDFFQVAMSITSVFVALHYWKIGAFGIGDVILIITYTRSLSGRLSSIGNILKSLKQLQADGDEVITDVLEKTTTVPDLGHETLSPKGGDIVFLDASFQYANNGEKVLQDFDLTIKQGEKIGIVGTSGSGKTTLIKLIMREMDITSGKLLIDSKPIQNIGLKTLYNSISLVPQEPALFHRSIKHNIAYARPEATYEEVLVAAKQAQAHDFITTLSSHKHSGYDTRVGERGIKLSGGQRQRVALARAFLANRPILILDEATSALDSISEAEIQKALEELLKKDGTVICIAHRLATVKQMDRIIVMEHGKIIEDGNHESLLAKNGHYAALVDAQTL